MITGVELGVRRELPRSGTQMPLSLDGKEVSEGLNGSRGGVPAERQTGSHGCSPCRRAPECCERRKRALQTLWGSQDGEEQTEDGIERR